MQKRMKKYLLSSLIAFGCVAVTIGTVTTLTSCATNQTDGDNNNNNNGNNGGNGGNNNGNDNQNQEYTINVANVLKFEELNKIIAVGSKNLDAVVDQQSLISEILSATSKTVDLATLPINTNLLIESNFNPGKNDEITITKKDQELVLTCKNEFNFTLDGICNDFLKYCHFIYAENWDNQYQQIFQKVVDNFKNMLVLNGNQITTKFPKEPLPPVQEVSTSNLLIFNWLLENVNNQYVNITDASKADISKLLFSSAKKLPVQSLINITNNVTPNVSAVTEALVKNSDVAYKAGADNLITSITNSGNNQKTITLKQTLSFNLDAIIMNGEKFWDNFILKSNKIPVQKRSQYIAELNHAIHLIRSSVQINDKSIVFTVPQNSTNGN